MLVGEGAASRSKAGLSARTETPPLSMHSL